jgi:hypothetical protein
MLLLLHPLIGSSAPDQPWVIVSRLARHLSGGALDDRIFGEQLTLCVQQEG